MNPNFYINSRLPLPRQGRGGQQPTDDDDAIAVREGVGITKGKDIRKG